MRICAFLIVAFSFSTVVCAAEPKAEREYLIKLKVSQGKADAKAGDPAIKVLSAPQVMTLEGKTCNLQVGGTILLPDFGTKVAEHAETGIMATLNCRKADDESVRLSMKINFQEVVENQPETFVLSDVGARVLLKAKLNTPVKTVLNEKNKLVTWIEVEVEDTTGTN
jgi:hypothetical protein